MSVYVDTPLYCDDCINCKYEGEIMVGTDATGGGPESAYSCNKDRNMGYYHYHRSAVCPDFDEGYGTVAEINAAADAEWDATEWGWED